MEAQTIKPIRRISTYRGLIGEVKSVYTRTTEKTVKITCSKDANDFFYWKFDECMDDHEQFRVIFLNNSNCIVAEKLISIGGFTGTMVDVRQLFHHALIIKCTSIIIAHNHPSGKLSPSMSDQQLTQKIKKAGDLLDIKLLDHLIITRNGYLSLADESIL